MRKIPVPDIQALLIDALETLPDQRKEVRATTCVARSECARRRTHVCWVH
jgi:hypothetical protein